MDLIKVRSLIFKASDNNKVKESLALLPRKESGYAFRWKALYPVKNLIAQSLANKC